MGEPMSLRPEYRRRLDELAQLDFNYDVKVYQESKERSGWNIDKYRTQVGQEPPGPPVMDGAFDRIKSAILQYRFSDPRLIRAYYDPETDLSGRNMLLKGSFLGFSFYFGVRITAVFDETRKNSLGQTEQIWGYAYRTLKGHFEVGEIRFEVCKNLQTGVIEFEIDAYSKPDRIPNLFYRLGFKIFGRSLQKYFAHSSIRRMRDIARTPKEQSH